MPTDPQNLPCDPELFELLICPDSKSPLMWLAEREVLISTDSACRRQYRVEQGVPIMLVEESEQLSPEDWETAMASEGPRTA